MKFVKSMRGIFVIALLILWAGYAVLNMIDRAAYVRLGFNEGWDIESKLDGAAGAANAGVFLQGGLQNANAYIDDSLNRQTSNELTIVRGDNGQLSYSSYYPFETYSFEAQADSLRQIQAYMQEQGGSFLYLSGMDAYVEGSSSYGAFPVANLNPRADAFLYYLNGFGVDYLDARAVLEDSALPPSEYRYKTETKWTVQASFEAYLAMVEELKQQGSGIAPDAARGQFEQASYPKSFVGHIGKRVGIPSVEYEDFTLITPAYQTDFTVESITAEGTLHKTEQGDFSTVILDTEWMEKQNPYERDMYSTYLTGEYPLRVIHNNLAADGEKVLFIGDSSMLPVASFLAPSVGELHLLWLYTVPNGYDNLIEYCEENGIDSVIVGMAPGSLGNVGFGFLDGIDSVASGAS